MLPVALPTPTSSLRLSNYCPDLSHWSFHLLPSIFACIATYDQQSLALAALTMKEVLCVDLARYYLLFWHAKVKKTQILKYKLKCISSPIIYRQYFFFLFFGENGQIPQFSKICSKKALFQNFLGKYHFYGT